MLTASEIIQMVEDSVQDDRRVAQIEGVISSYYRLYNIGESYSLFRSRFPQAFFNSQINEAGLLVVKSPAWLKRRIGNLNKIQSQQLS